MKKLKISPLLLFVSLLVLFFSCSGELGITDEQAERIMEVLSSASYSFSSGSRLSESKSVEYVSGSYELEEKAVEFTYRLILSNYICIHTDEDGIQTEYLMDGVYHLDVSIPEDVDCDVNLDIYTDGIDEFSIIGGDIDSLVEIDLHYDIYSPSAENDWEGSYTCTGTINGIEYIDKPGSLFSIEFVE